MHLNACHYQWCPEPSLYQHYEAQLTMPTAQSKARTRTDPQWVSRIHVQVEWKLIAELLSGGDHTRVYGKWLVGDGDVDWTSRAMDTKVDLAA